MQFELQRDSLVRNTMPNVASRAVGLRCRRSWIGEYAWHVISLLLLSASLISFPAIANAAQSGTAANSAAQSIKHPNEQEKPPHHARRHTRAKPHEQAPTPPTPPVPVPPAQQAAAPATVDYRDGQLRIDAQNSSLVQILTKISQETGLTVDGLGHDQRIYGQYGPGSMETTLSSLLDGAGYNYVLVGNVNGKSTPKLLLTPRSGDGGGVSSAAATTPVPFSAPANTTPQTANPSEPPHAKTPQEIFNELRRMHPQ
jgi:hypothetical protein